MKQTGKTHSNYRKPRPTAAEAAEIDSGLLLDITVGYGTIKFCTTENGWVLPSGSNQVNRLIKCEVTAQKFARKLDELIKRNLSMTSLNSRLIAYGG